MRISLFIIVGLFVASMIVSGCMPSPARRSVGAQNSLELSGLYVMYIDDADDSRCEQVKKRWFPLYEGNESHLDLISEAAFKSGYTFKLEPVHLYLHSEDKPSDYMIIVYFCSEMMSEDGNTITFISNGNWSQGYKFEINNEENLWELYYRAFTESINATSPSSESSSSADAGVSTNAEASGDAGINTGDEVVASVSRKTDSSSRATKAQDVGMDIEAFKTVFNLYRSQKSLGSVKLNDALNAAAKKWAEVKRDKRKKALKKPGKKGFGPSQFAHQSGYKANKLYTVASRFDVVDADIVAKKWLFDKKLKKTLTKKSVTDIGLACVEASYDTKKDTIISTVCVLLLANEKQDLLDLLREKNAEPSSP